MSTRNPINMHVGAKVREIRLAQGLSTDELAARAGLEPLQIEDIEAAENDVTARLILELSRALHVPFRVFFEDLDDFAANVPGAADPLVVEMTVYRNGKQLADGCFSLDSAVQNKWLSLLRESMESKPDVH